MNAAKAEQSTWWDVPSEDRPKRSIVALKDAKSFLRDALKCGGYVPVGLAARMLGVSRQRAYQMRDEGKLVWRHFYGTWFVEGDSLNDLMDERKKEKKT